MVHIKNLIKKTDSTVTIVHRLLVALVRCGVCVKQKFKVGSSLLYILFRSNQTEIVLFVLVPIKYGPFQFQHNRAPTTIRVQLVHVKSSLIIIYLTDHWTVKYLFLLWELKDKVNSLNISNIILKLWGDGNGWATCHNKNYAPQKNCAKSLKWNYKMQWDLWKLLFRGGEESWHS